MSDWNTKVIEEFQSNEGRVASFARQPLLLLTHRGARSGTLRTNPLAFFRDGDDYVIIASKGGAATNPDRYHNLLAEPRATIEVGTDQIDVIARPADEEERERLWAMITAANPAFADYGQKTTRTIPVFILTPVDDERAGQPLARSSARRARFSSCFVSPLWMAARVIGRIQNRSQYGT